MEKKHTKYLNTFYKYVWIFVIGCILGYIFEVLWYFIKNQVWLNKQGLLYGPFKPLYGIGAIILSVFLNPVRHKNNWWIFLYGIVLGTVFEYAASLFQEFVFGTYTWTYSGFVGSFSHRIYLPYCIVWGALALLWLRYVEPFITKPFDCPQKLNVQIITWSVAIFMIGNVALTSLANYRYSARANEKPATNIITRFIDRTYDDEYMRKKFVKLRIIKK